jgi:serine/threonine protein phosphatase PrpC
MGKEQPRSQAQAQAKTQAQARVQWRAVGESVQGAAHVRAGLPNQDAFRWLPASGVGPPLILAVSDGHGSPKYFRSHIGAELAVKEAVWVIQDLLDGQPDPANLSAIKRTAEDRLPREIVRRWRDAVVEHLRQMPLAVDELIGLEQQEGAAARRKVEDDPSLTYGATVLAVLVAEEFILYLQLGDGDILIVAENGEVSRPLEGDARLFANQTTSLCSPDAWRDFRARFQTLVDPPPALILLATDGYSNSFVSEAAFLQVGTDVLEMIRGEGLAAVEANLASWLAEASKAGSGDDITLGILCRTDVQAGPKADSLAEAVSGPKAGLADLPIDVLDEDVWTVTTTGIPRIRKKK